MSDSYPDPSAPATRGRRNPDIARQLRERMPEAELMPSELPVEPEDQLVAPEGELMPDEAPTLYPGDIITMRITHPVHFNGNRDASWVSYGVQSRVNLDEDRDEAYGRVAYEVTNGVVDAIIDADEALRRITPPPAAPARQQPRR